MKEDERLRDRIEKQAARMERAERDRPTLLAETAYVGVLALLFVVPVVGGAYLGSWLDGLMPGYSVPWTPTLLVVGVVVGAANVYFYVREH